MDQLGAIWSGLDGRRRFTVVGATIGMFVAVMLLAQMASKPSMSLLYAGLDASSAGEVVASLEARGALVEVRGPAIYVEAGQRDALRLALAGEGLPQNGGQGYELLDALTGFGTTAQMFDAAYWRAKEGELARTITANRQFTAARVHISNPASDPFRQGQVESASVSVALASGSMSQGQAMALRYLIASAVTGLDPAMVTVIDSESGLVPHDDSTSASGNSDAREEALRASVTRLMEARVGVGRAIVEVTVDPVTEREEFIERRFEPDSRVPISSDSEETTTRSTNAQGNGVTVASNLPEGDAGGASGASESSETRTREVVNYEVSETERAILREPGAVRRISVAVLVDGVQSTAEDGTVSWEPRSAEELADMRELVASAVGFDEARGDQITMRSMEFQPPVQLEDPVPLSFLDRTSFDILSLAQLAVLALVSLILGLFVIRPILTSAPRPQVAQIALTPSGETSDGSDIASLSAIDGEIGDIGPLDDFEPLDLPAFDSMGGDPDPADRLRQLIEDKQDETVEVLSQWMNDPKEEAVR